MMSEQNANLPPVTSVIPFALIGNADAEMCGPDGCAIPAGHAAHSGGTTPVEPGSKPVE